jgi:alpha-glucosidase
LNKDSNVTDPWWQGAVIYEVYPLSFRDTNGDGFGDLRGILENLSYVASLGVDAIWVCPFFKSPLRDFGYDVSDYYTVDPVFGSLDEAQELIDSAHRLGMKVIFDMVPCHTSIDHSWFKDSRSSRANSKADWYIWADPKPDGTVPNNWLSPFGGTGWEWEPRRMQYYFHSFLPSQPALNVSNPEVLRAILDVMRFWYDKGVDGFRLDAITALAPDVDLRSNPPVASYKPLPFVDLGESNPFLKQIHMFDRDSENVIPILGQFRELADQYDPPRFLFGEIGDVDGCAVGAKYAAPNLIHASYIQDLLLLQPELTSQHAAAVIRRQTTAAHDFWVFNAFSSHDIARPVTRWRALASPSGDNADLARLLMGLLLSLRGCACIYQGEELGLTDVDLPYDSIRDTAGLNFYPDYKGRDSCRTPMPWVSAAPHAGFTSGTPWLPLGPDHPPMAVDVQEANPKSVLNSYRHFIKWRKQHRILSVGSLQVIDAPSPLFAFVRSANEKRMLLVFNLSNCPIEWEPNGSWEPVEGHRLPEASKHRRTLRFRGLDVFIAYGTEELSCEAKQ